jgi:hypothetical protein
MFHFPTFPPTALCVQAEVTGHDSSWVSPFGHPRITARLPTPRGLSQAPTSFIGSWCQGIHHVHLVACHYVLQRCSRPLCSSQTTTGNPHHPAPTHHPTTPPRGGTAANGSRTAETRIPEGRQTPDPSGPNSVPTPPPPSDPRFHTSQAGSTDRPPRRRRDE